MPLNVLLSRNTTLSANGFQRSTIVQLLAKWSADRKFGRSAGGPCPASLHQQRDDQDLSGTQGAPTETHFNLTAQH